MNKLGVYWITDDDNIWTHIKCLSKDIEFKDMSEALAFAVEKASVIRDPMAEYLVIGWATEAATAKDMPLVEWTLYFVGGKLVIESNEEASSWSDKKFENRRDSYEFFASPNGTIYTVP